MRFVLKLLIVIAVVALVAGLLTYPTWLLVRQISDYPPDRVMHRVGELLLIAALWWILRQAGAANRATFGYGISRSAFIRQMTFGFGAGLLLMLPFAAGLFGLGVRIWEFQGSRALIESIIDGLIAGWALAFVEETTVRGAMFSAVERESGALAAIVLTSLLFAAAHFLQASLRIPAEEMNFQAGLRIVIDIFSRYTTPLQFVDAFAALFALGVLLALVRLRTGAIAGSIGVHAAGVAVIFAIGDNSKLNTNFHPHWLVPSYNNVVGWLLFAWIAAVATAYWRIGYANRRMIVPTSPRL